MDGTTPCRGRLVVDPAHKHPEGALCAAGGFYPPLRLALRNHGDTIQTHDTPSALHQRAKPGTLPLQKTQSRESSAFFGGNISVYSVTAVAVLPSSFQFSAPEAVQI